jgi:hypothetical protein
MYLNKACTVTMLNLFSHNSTSIVDDSLNEKSHRRPSRHPMGGRTINLKLTFLGLYYNASSIATILYTLGEATTRHQ